MPARLFILGFHRRHEPSLQVGREMTRARLFQGRTFPYHYTLKFVYTFFVAVFLFFLVRFYLIRVL
jgi:hypothetical protein